MNYINKMQRDSWSDSIGGGIYPRSLKELYKLLLTQFMIDPPYQGICYSMNFLRLRGMITSTELDILEDDFLSRKPKSIFNKFTWSKYYTGKTYWWKALPEGDAQRIKFIQHRIKRSK